MPGVTRCGDVHACGAIAITCSGTVFVDGIGVHRCSDLDGTGCHSIAVQVACSGTTFAEDLGFGRCGDNHGGDPCPHPPNPHVSCSSTTFADG